MHGAAWGPAKAREKAKSMLGAVADGGDPMTERNEGRRRLTVREWGERYLSEVAGPRAALAHVQRRPGLGASP